MSLLAKRLLPGGALLLLVVLIGCGRSDVVQVTGTLKYKGKPVPNALLTFEPEKGRQSWAQTDNEGRFKINYDADRDGAVVGKHKVWVEYRPTGPDPDAGGKLPAVPKEFKEFFSKYSGEKSTYYVQITSSTRELNLDLD